MDAAGAACLNFAAYKKGKRARERGSTVGTSSRCDVVVGGGGISFCEERVPPSVYPATKMKRGEGVQEVGQSSNKGTQKVANLLPRLCNY